jgi:hypothetical protein
MDGLLAQKGVPFERQQDGLFLHDPSYNALLLSTAELSKTIVDKEK